MLTTEETRREEVLEALAHLWTDAYREACARVGVIEHYVGAVVASGEAAEARRAAADAAHKLAGTLGTFGFSVGSELSRTIESSLEDCASDACTAVAIADELASLRDLLEAAAPEPSLALSDRIVPQRDGLHAGTALVLGGERALVESARFEVQRLGLRLAGSLDEVREWADGRCIAVIDHTDEASTVAAVERAYALGAVVVVTGVDGQFAYRMALVRAGAQLVLDRSSSAERAIHLALQAQERLIHDPVIAVIDEEAGRAMELVAELVDLGCRARAIEVESTLADGADGLDGVVVGSAASTQWLGTVIAALRADPRWDRVTVMAWCNPGGLLDQHLLHMYADEVIDRALPPEIIAERVTVAVRRHRRITDATVLAPELTDVVPPIPRVGRRTERAEVIVVDDDPTVRALLGDVLDHEGFTMRPVADGLAAAEILTDPAELEGVAVVLLDISLPGLDGFGVLRRMRAAGTIGRVPVVMLTARSGDEDVLRALDLGVTEYIAKPFSIPVLAQWLRRLTQPGPA